MRDGRKYRIVNVTTTADSNPLTWTKETLDDLTENEEVIGYFIRRTNNKVTINLYTLPLKYTQSTISLTDLYEAYAQCLINAAYDKNKTAIIFHNPPIENWLDTKVQWIKKTANKLSNVFNKPYDEMLSHVNYAIVKAFNNKNVYVGNLGYIERSAYNEVLMDIRYNRNRLNLDNTEKVTALDDSFEIDGTEHTLNDIYGEEDQNMLNHDFEETAEEIKKVLKLTFSDREIDQIINSQGQLPINIYRRLLKWRKQHKRGDFNVK